MSRSDSGLASAPGRDPAADAAGPALERIVLVGFMGAGKSTVGTELARLLDWSFVDMDRWIEEQAGLTIAHIFEQRGEAAFRDLERRLAEDLAGRRRCVVAAGGGAFAGTRTRRALRSGALTVWLQCDFETALGRLPADGSRPLAANHERMAALFAQREASYRLADWAVDASAASPQEVAHQIWETVMGRGTLSR